MDMIDQIGGWKSVSGVGMSYGEWYGLEQQRMWFIDCSITPICPGLVLFSSDLSFGVISQDMRWLAHVWDDYQLMEQLGISV